MDLTSEEIRTLKDEAARAAIRDTLLRYCRGVDRADEALFVSAFHPGAIDNHGPHCGPVEPFAARTVGVVRDATIGIQHVLGNMLVELDGDQAKVETYFQATYRPKSAPEMISVFGGRYLDLFEKRGGAWRIARRTVVNDWSYRDELAEDLIGTKGYLRGSPDAADPLLRAETWTI